MKQNDSTSEILLNPILPRGVMGDWNPSRIAGLMLYCGKIAIGHFRNFKWVLKEDKSLLTEADTAIEKEFASRFDCPTRGIHMIGEETSDDKSGKYIDNALSGKCWIVDPIDGTAPFACNVPTWGISIGYSENSVLRHGCVFLPYFGEMFISIGNSSYYAENINCVNPPLGIRFRKIKKTSANFADGGLVSISQDASKQGVINFDNPVQAVCCTVYTIAGLLKGRYSAYIGSSKLWDLAGALPILLNTGFVAELKNGEKIRYEISKKNCFIHNGNANVRWRYRDNLLIAGDKSTIHEIKKKIVLKYPYK